MIRLILFDLDGTFVDTAFDLVESANKVYKNNNKLNISYEAGREIASDGIKSFLRYRFDEQEDNFNLLSKEFLDIYNQNFLNNPLLFNGIQHLLKDLASNGVKWGIVTNKARYFAENIIEHHNLTAKCSVLMCGDDKGFNQNRLLIYYWRHADFLTWIFQIPSMLVMAIGIFYLQNQQKLNQY